MNATAEPCSRCGAEVPHSYDGRPYGAGLVCGACYSALTAAHTPRTTADEIRPPEAADGGATWPEPMRPEAFHGPLGALVRVIEPQTEADPHALLLSVLTAFGNVVGHGPGLRIDGARHTANLDVVIVGPTAKARKTTSWNRIEQACRQVDPDWCGPAHVVDGLSTGEGLIWAVRDPIRKTRRATKKDHADPAVAHYIADGFVTEVEDLGVSDKRLMVQEGEFGRVLEVMLREGNTLSAVIRRLWETGSTRTLTRNNPAQTTDAHVSILAHAPLSELRAKLTDASRANGFANRFLFSLSRRARKLPFGGQLRDEDLTKLTEPLREAALRAKNVEDLEWGEDARPLWESVYDELSEGKPGMWGAIVARAEAHCVRLAVLYALADQSTELRLEHVEAALAVWDYCERSAAYIFHGMLGNPDADRVLRDLEAAAERGKSRTELRDLFDRHVTTAQLDAALSLLHRRLLAEPRRIETGGRPAERWFIRRSPSARSKQESGVESPGAKPLNAENVLSTRPGAEENGGIPDVLRRQPGEEYEDWEVRITAEFASEDREEQDGA